VIDNTPVVSDAEDASDLEYDENERMQIDESDDDGSEFEIDSDTEDENEITMRPAGRRLAPMNAKVEFGFEIPSDSLSDHSTSSEEIPLASSSKSKSRATKKAVPFSEEKQIMNMSKLRAAQRGARKALLSARLANKREEMVLRTKLGRRLTHASLLPQLIFISNL
jgi:hypothetical protein